MESPEIIGHFTKIKSLKEGLFVEETFFFSEKGQTYLFRYDLKDRPQIVQHCCAVSRDINRHNEHYFYGQMFDVMSNYPDLKKIIDENQ